MLCGLLQPVDSCYSKCGWSALQAPGSLLEMQHQRGLPLDLLNHNMHFHKIPQVIHMHIKVWVYVILVLNTLVLGITSLSEPLLIDLKVEVFLWNEPIPPSKD